MENNFDLIVIGAGSGGLAAAKRAAAHGARVAIIEGDRVGGTCVIRGCVPKKLLVYGSSYGESIKNGSKYGIDFNEVSFNTEILLSNIRNEVNRLNCLHIDFLKRAGVRLFKGWAEFLNKNSIAIKESKDAPITDTIRGEMILIAVGGGATRPKIKGSSVGLISDDMFLMKKYPEHMVIVGGGFIACEFACILTGLGTKVTQLVRGNNLLKGFDCELSENLKKSMIANNIEVYFGETVNELEKTNDHLKVTTDKREIKCDELLFAVGRKPSLDGLGLDKVGIKYDQNKIYVGSQNATNISNIYAIGDVTNRANLTPVAIEEGRSFSDNIFGNKNRIINYNFIPKAVFSQPELASVGLSEEEAVIKYGEGGINVFRASFIPMSQTLSYSRQSCFMKLIVSKKSDKILGCHMLGEHSAEIIQMASIALSIGATKSDFDKTMALHPTVSEEFVTMSG